MLVSNMLRHLEDPINDFMYMLPSNMWTVNQKPRNRVWTETCNLTGFDPNEVSIKQKKEDDGQVKVEIKAKHESGEDFSEVKKTIKLPENVDCDKLRTLMRRDGVLVLKAPFKCNHQEHGTMAPLSLARHDSWNGVWGEMDRLNNQMTNIIESLDGVGVARFPRSEVVPSEDGHSNIWRLKIQIGDDFAPEDVKLINLNNQIKLEARKEIKGEQGLSCRYLSESVSIPEGVEHEKLKCSMLANGELVIEAPTKNLPPVQDQGCAIPIKNKSDNSGDKQMTVDN